MNPSKQWTKLPKVQTNNSGILSEIRAYLKDRHHFVSISSKNGESQLKEIRMSNHSSLNYIKVTSPQRSLMQRYKKLREIQAPYKCLVDNERRATDGVERDSPSSHVQSWSRGREKAEKYFRRNEKHSISRDNKKKYELMMVAIKKQEERKNCKQLSYCINLVPGVSSNFKSKHSSEDELEGSQINLKPRRGKMKPKSFLRQIKKSRRQSIKVLPYEPWEINNAEESDFVY